MMTYSEVLVTPPIRLEDAEIRIEWRIDVVAGDGVRAGWITAFPVLVEAIRDGETEDEIPTIMQIRLRNEDKSIDEHRKDT